jgi:excisionase family DNA binding protein
MTSVIAFTPANDFSASTRPHPAGRMVYTVKEVAEMLQLNLGGTYVLIRSGQIPAKKLGNRWVIPIHRFHAWLDAQTEPGPEARTA